MKGYYHIYADRKTVKPITESQYFRLAQGSSSLVCWLDEEGIVFVKEANIIHIPFEQLNQILVPGDSEKGEGKT